MQHAYVLFQSRCWLCFSHYRLPIRWVGCCMHSGFWIRYAFLVFILFKKQPCCFIRIHAVVSSMFWSLNDLRWSWWPCSVCPQGRRFGLPPGPPDLAIEFLYRELACRRVRFRMVRLKPQVFICRVRFRTPRSTVSNSICKVFRISICVFCRSAVQGGKSVVIRLTSVGDPLRIMTVTFIGDSVRQGCSFAWRWCANCVISCLRATLTHHAKRSRCH
jgi:hypothetical protein